MCMERKKRKGWKWWIRTKFANQDGPQILTLGKMSPLFAWCFIWAQPVHQAAHPAAEALEKGSAQLDAPQGPLAATRE